MHSKCPPGHAFCGNSNLHCWPQSQRMFHPHNFRGPHHFRPHPHHHWHHKMNMKPFNVESSGPIRQGNQPRIQIIEIGGNSDEVVRPGEAVEKTWTFRNTCAEPWSPEYALTHLRGPNLTVGASNIIAVGEVVLPGETVTITMEMIAPPIPGRYCSYWRMADASGCYFGPRVWSSITVSNPSQ